MNAPAGRQELLRSGNRRSLGRAITALENDGDAAVTIRADVAAHFGAAHVVGVTGPLGGGKSTLVAALLGDRVCMGLHQSDPGVFIRSMASRGHLGGPARSATDVVDLLDAADFLTVIVETVGAGQSEVEITRIADTRLVV